MTVLVEMHCGIVGCEFCRHVNRAVRQILQALVAAAPDAVPYDVIRRTVSRGATRRRLEDALCLLVHENIIEPDHTTASSQYRMTS